MKTKNLAVGVLAAVLIVALWWTMLLKPTRAKASKVRAATADEQSKLTPLQAQLSQAQQAAAHASALQAQLLSLELAMPKSPALAAFIRDANAIAEASGVSWQSVTHGVPTLGTGGVTTISVGIQIKGTYPQVMDYLGRLAQLPRLLVVDSVQLTTAPDTGAGGATAPSGESTGPFSGASQLAAVISARMFEAPGAAVGTAGTAGTGVSTTGGTTAPATGSSAPALNNS